MGSKWATGPKEDCRHLQLPPIEKVDNEKFGANNCQPIKSCPLARFNQEDSRSTSSMVMVVSVYTYIEVTLFSNKVKKKKKYTHSKAH